MKRAIYFSHESGDDIEITENQLAALSDADLDELRISRDELHRIFAEGQRLMAESGIVESDRVRPVASATLDGEWFVVLIRYSTMQGPISQSRKGH